MKVEDREEIKYIVRTQIESLCEKWLLRLSIGLLCVGVVVGSYQLGKIAGHNEYYKESK